MPTLVTRGAASVRGFGFAGTSPVLADPYFNYTTLLLHGNGTNGGQNNTFLDSGTANGGVGFDITRNGNTTQGTFSPFSQTGWSNYFDGSGDYLQLADSTAWDLTGDYTIEMWLYKTSSSSQTFFMIGSGGSTSILLYQNASNIIIFNTSAAVITASISAPLNQWNHLALVRSGSGSNNTVMYLNGVNVGQATNTASFTGDASNGLRIGAEYPTGYEYTGYISNVRVVKGTAVYTGAFTPPTSPLAATQSAGTNIAAITGTQTSLLTCQSNRFIDNSSNAFTITVNGNTSVQAFSPFAPTAAYSASTVGGSGYFDGSGDNLAISSGVTDQFDPGSAFTFECWVYFASGNNNQCFQVRGSSNDWSGSTGILFEMYSNDSGTSRWQFNGNGSAISVSGTAPPNGTWAHLAVGYNGTTTRFWINGQSVGTSTSSYTKPTYSNVAIGSNVSNNTPLNGFMSSLRFVKGADVYGVSNTSITVPTAPLTTTVSSGTVSLLCNFTNAAIIDNTAKNVLETVGNAQISTTQSKFGGASIYLDGTGDYLKYLGTVTAGFGSGNFTIEFWINAPSSNDKFILALRGGLSGGPHVTTGGYGGTTVGALRWASNAGEILSGTTLITDNTWHHCAIVRNGSTITLYVDGVNRGSGTDTTSFDGNGGQILIGENNLGGNTLTGYIDDLRITKGIARYTSNFTPQTSQWQDQ